MDDGRALVSQLPASVLVDKIQDHFEKMVAEIKELRRMLVNANDYINTTYYLIDESQSNNAREIEAYLEALNDKK